MTTAGPAARLLEALDAADTKGLSKADVCILLDCTAAEAKALVERACAADRAYLAEDRRIYSTAPF